MKERLWCESRIESSMLMLLLCINPIYKMPCIQSPPPFFYSICNVILFFLLFFAQKEKNPTSGNFYTYTFSSVVHIVFEIYTNLPNCSFFSGIQRKYNDHLMMSFAFRKFNCNVQLILLRFVNGNFSVAHSGHKTKKRKYHRQSSSHITRVWIFFSWGN